MEKIKNGFKWVLRNFFFIFIVVFIVTYIRAEWYRLFDGIMPILIWVLANILFAIGLRIATLRSWVGWIFLIVLIFMFFINAFIVFLEIQTKVIDFAKYNGINYFIVEHMTWDSWESPYQLEKRCGYHMCGSYSLNGAPSMGFFYESKSNLVHVIGRYENEEWLIFTDSNPPRNYERYYDDFMQHRFYRTVNCTKWEKDAGGHDLCNAYRLTVYECELNNTECVPISQYIGKESESYFEISETPNEMNLFIFTVSGGQLGHKLVFSYGDNPRCYVEGCEILSQP